MKIPRVVNGSNTALILAVLYTDKVLHNNGLTIKEIHTKLNELRLVRSGNTGPLTLSSVRTVLHRHVEPHALLPGTGSGRLKQQRGMLERGLIKRKLIDRSYRYSITALGKKVLAQR